MFLPVLAVFLACLGAALGDSEISKCPEGDSIAAGELGDALRVAVCALNDSTIEPYHAKIRAKHGQTTDGAFVSSPLIITFSAILFGSTIM